MILYGRNPVREALRGRREVRRIWAAGSAAEEPWLSGHTVAQVHPAELEELGGSREHQGICAEVSPFGYAEADELMSDDNAVVVCLDEVQDPHNLGAVCRVAEGAGAAGVVIPERRSAEVTPAVCKASAGAVEHLPVARVRNLADWIGSAKDSGAWVYGAATGPSSVAYDQPDYAGRVVIVLGSEGRGLRPRVADGCDQLIAVPQLGRLDSLNVSTAAAVVVYGILHFRGRSLDKAT